MGVFSRILGKVMEQSGMQALVEMDHPSTETMWDGVKEVASAAWDKALEFI
jgi:hypothetical protein